MTAVLVLAGCTGTDPEPAPTPEAGPTAVELPVALDDGFERGKVALISPPPGFTATLETVAGWGLLAATPKCAVRARTGVTESDAELDPRTLTAELIAGLAAREGATVTPTETELAQSGMAGAGLPVLEAAWQSPEGPVRAVARVARSLSYDDRDPLTYRAVVVELRCEGAVEEADLDAAWAHVLDALRANVGGPITDW